MTNSDARQSERIMKARCRLMICEPFYGHVSINMNWISHDMSWKAEQDRTMGVRIVNGGEVQCLFYPPFVEKLSIEELYGVIQHEIEHIVRCHCTRIGNRNAKKWNIAADMVVNGKRTDPRIGYMNSQGERILPNQGDMIWIPDQWDSDLSTEQYYEMIDDQIPDDLLLDDHDVWQQSDVSEDEIRQVVKNLVDEAADRSQGRVPSHLESAIKNLNKPVVRWRELLRQYIGNFVGNKRFTYSRRNRKDRSFGVKGISKHATSEINIILDVSGSIKDDELQQFFTEIEAISYKSKIWLLQWDDRFRGYDTYRRGDWKKISVRGRGNTDMAAPIEWLCDNKLIKSVQIMLTDGYCEYSQQKNINYICVITTDDEYTQLPDWGHIVRMQHF